MQQCVTVCAVVSLYTQRRRGAAAATRRVLYIYISRRSTAALRCGFRVWKFKRHGNDDAVAPQCVLYIIVETAVDVFSLLRYFQIYVSSIHSAPKSRAVPAVPRRLIYLEHAAVN